MIIIAEKNDKRLMLEKEIAERCRIMDDPSYYSGPPLNKTDYICIACVSIVSIIGLIIGIASV
ncbi:hypothetical protein SSCH_320014 [Syntrophaceticus schinkii]|uniref:Uncharacterized protein n=1 Tax=Syntrophaceticus schinkii TaxID=499207 RepID=A0A0B7MMP1_9FIRM|nr:hypothetical protein SSCH_1910001 [Syntrophaceticus schinkii]CEO88982.1 hypothetical protein SSCH_320014 [Syntrophaceticus schinkii]